MRSRLKQVQTMAKVSEREGADRERCLWRNGSWRKASSGEKRMVTSKMVVQATETTTGLSSSKKMNAGFPRPASLSSPERRHLYHLGSLSSSPGNLRRIKAINNLHSVAGQWSLTFTLTICK